MKLASSLLLLAFSLTVLPKGAAGQTAAASPSPAVEQKAQAPQTTEYTLPPDKLAKSKALYQLGGKLRIIDTVYGLLVLLGLLYFGIAAKYRDWAEKVSSKRLVQAVIFVPLLMLTITVLDLPLDAYGHHVGREYGLSVQGWASWFADLGKGFLVGLVIFILVIWGVTQAIRKSPRRWWFYTWVVAMPVVVFLVFIAPVVLDPLFNNFAPLDKSNPQLVDAIEKVVGSAGQSIPRDRIFLMDASKKVTTLNAYVTGFGPSKRIVIWDTTIKNASTPETLSVVGHEMGHYVLNHIRIGIVATAIGLFVGFYLLYVISNWLFSRLKERWYMRELWDWAAVPILLLIFSVMSIATEGINNTISRQLEHNADVYGLEVTHKVASDPAVAATIYRDVSTREAAAHAFQILGELSLTYPYPSKAVVFWYYNHPPISDRVRFAHTYDPWSKGEQPKYVK
ncbi:MAG TPA: M48 family metallopeptidase [Candidatus Angelobacter sp.]|nr:M48 family metallopeptidase [Candidatus Angelobacter sp.]